MDIGQILGEHRYTFPFRMEKVDGKIVPDFFPGDFNTRISLLFDYKLGEEYRASVWESGVFIKSEQTGEVYFVPEDGATLKVEGDLAGFLSNISRETKEEKFKRLLEEGWIIAQVMNVRSSTLTNHTTLEVRLVENPRLEWGPLGAFESYLIFVDRREGRGSIVEAKYHYDPNGWYPSFPLTKANPVKLPKPLLQAAQPELLHSIVTLDDESMHFIRNNCYRR